MAIDRAKARITRMTRRLSVAFALLWLAAPQAIAETRVALVIGNAAY